MPEKPDEQKPTNGHQETTDKPEKLLKRTHEDHTKPKPNGDGEKR